MKINWSKGLITQEVVDTMIALCTCYDASYDHEPDMTSEGVYWYCNECKCTRFKLLGYVYEALSIAELVAVRGEHNGEVVDSQDGIE